MFRVEVVLCLLVDVVLYIIRWFDVCYLVNLFWFWFVWKVCWSFLRLKVVFFNRVVGIYRFRVFWIFVWVNWGEILMFSSRRFFFLFLFRSCLSVVGGIMLGLLYFCVVCWLLCVCWLKVGEGVLVLWLGWLFILEMDELSFFYFWFGGFVRFRKKGGFLNFLILSFDFVERWGVFW